MVTSKKTVLVRLGTVLTAAALAMPLLTATTASAAKAPAQTSFPRNETLITTGTAGASATSFNPNNTNYYPMGTRGLLYETLFHFDPLHLTYDPWLATAGSWSNATTYTLTVRSGVDWVSSPSGSVVGTLSAADVVFSLKLALNTADLWNQYMTNVTGVTSSGNTVTVTFSSPVPYLTWQEALWNVPIEPATATGGIGALPAAQQLTAANLTPVSTGPMVVVYTNTSETCYQTNTNWWGASIGLSFKFKYLCDQVNLSNNAALADFMAGDVDWNNNFMPIGSLLTGPQASALNIKTYFPKAPYMLPTNTAFLLMNDQKAPFSNVDFRKAVAMAINGNEITDSVYGGLAEGITNPVGLLPYLSSYLDKAAISQYGYTYNPTQAKSLLAQSGYKGQALTIEAPSGWTDWNMAQVIIAQQLNAVGIKVTPIYPSMGTDYSDRFAGSYDFTIWNPVGIAATPYSYFQWVYAQPVVKQQDNMNQERSSDTAAWALVEKASSTPASDAAALTTIYNQLQSDFLQDQPLVPMWYNGAWFQGRNFCWSDFPSSANKADQNTPITWDGWLNETTINAFAALVPSGNSACGS